MKYIISFLLTIFCISCVKISDCEIGSHECKVFDVRNDTIVLLDKNINEFVEIKYDNDTFYPYELCDILEMQFSTPTFILGYCKVHNHYFKQF